MHLPCNLVVACYSLHPCDSDGYRTYFCLCLSPVLSRPVWPSSDVERPNVGVVLSTWLVWFYSGAIVYLAFWHLVVVGDILGRLLLGSCMTEMPC